jgi:outer membrane protein assembly factor BamB
VPRLSLRGTAIPVIAKELAVSGFDNGKVMAVSLATGDTVWDTALASPHGRTELDRLVDIDSAVRVVGDDVFAAGFQGRIAMLALDSGQIWWAHDMSTYRGLSADGEDLYVAQADGIVVALHQRDGSEIWRNVSLKRRGLSTPVETSTAVAVVDYQGYLHWLDKKTGFLVAREHVSKYRVANQPVSIDDTVVILDDGGRLAAFRANPAGAGPPHSDPVPPPPKPPKPKKDKKLPPDATK